MNRLLIIPIIVLAVGALILFGIYSGPLPKAKPTDFSKNELEVKPKDFNPSPLAVRDFVNVTTGKCPTEGFLARSCVVAQQLIRLNGSEIAGYGLVEYDNNVILGALSLLEAKDLEKVIQNLPTQDLIILKERLGMETLNATLNRINLSDRQAIYSKLTQ